MISNQCVNVNLFSGVQCMHFNLMFMFLCLRFVMSVTAVTLLYIYELLNKDFQLHKSTHTNRCILFTTVNIWSFESI